ncbi:MAG: putative CRISPR-associated protein [Anaerolineae bacterium]|nr:putative CRISPR-associated protein [Anaerolineae bacterium]
MRNRLISTVGTSFLSNIRGTARADNGIDTATHDLLRDLLDKENWGQLARELSKVPSSARICGAEINSINEIVKRRKFTLEYLHFFVSDTPDGLKMGQLLDSYVIEAGLPDLRLCTIHPLADLQNKEPSRFKIYGLRNLVRELGKIANQYGANTLTIDATGGYKAQIAIAVVFGQALGIPVLYRHESFSEIIDFPPMPIIFDYDLLGQNAALLAAFERGEALTLKEIESLDEKVRVFLEEIEVDGENVFELGAVGQIFLTGFRAKFPRSRQLVNVEEHERKAPTFREDHYPIGFKEFVQKVWLETGWFKSCHSLPYDRQESIKGTGFFVREGKLIGTFQDKDKFGARFEILTAADGQDQLTWAADQLNQKYGTK